MQAVLSDWHTAPVNDKLRAMLGLLEKVTLTPQHVNPSDIQPLLAMGITESAIEDALLICACFNLIARVADTLDVSVPDASGFAFTADRLLEHGYL